MQEPKKAPYDMKNSLIIKYFPYDPLMMEIWKFNVKSCKMMAIIKGDNLAVLLPFNK